MEYTYFSLFVIKPVPFHINDFDNRIKFWLLDSLHKLSVKIKKKKKGLPLTI